MGSMTQVTDLLHLLKDGDKTVENKLIDAVYSELRKIAAICIRNERPGHILQPTALLNEAYLRLRRQNRKEWQSRAHYLAVAAQVMRRVLVDYARAQQSDKRPPTSMRVEMTPNLAAAASCWEDYMLDVDAALGRLEKVDPRQARILGMRFFAGMTESEIAELEGISTRTVKRDSGSGLAWLKAELRSAPRLAAVAARS